jgi:CcmB protein
LGKTDVQAVAQLGAQIGCGARAFVEHGRRGMSGARLLREIDPGVVWVAALLAGLLWLPRLFVSDHHDGTLE